MHAEYLVSKLTPVYALKTSDLCLPRLSVKENWEASLGGERSLMRRHFSGWIPGSQPSNKGIWTRLWLS